MNRVGTRGILSPMTSNVPALTVVLLVLAGAGCRHTAEGVKTDTKRAIEKTGHGIERLGEKIESVGASDAGR